MREPAGEGAGGEGIGNESAVGIAWIWASREVVMVDVVFVSVCNAFGAGLALYHPGQRCRWLAGTDATERD